MKNTTTTEPSLIEIKEVENLYIDKIELDTAFRIRIEKVENLHVGKIEPAATITNQSHTCHHELSARPALSNSQIVLVCYYVLLSWVCGA